jgi:hypothetical protein
MLVTTLAVTRMLLRELNVKVTIDILRRRFVNREGLRTELEEYIDYPATGKNVRPEDLQVYCFAQHSSVHFCNYCGCTLDYSCLIVFWEFGRVNSPTVK